jgi:hypothetical protein
MHKEQQHSNELVLVGGGALALEVLSFIQEINIRAQKTAIRIAYVIDANGGRADDLKTIDPNIAMVLSIADIPTPKNYRGLICVGDAVTRWQLFQQLDGTFSSWASIIHPSLAMVQSSRQMPMLGPLQVLVPMLLSMSGPRLVMMPILVIAP